MSVRSADFSTLPWGERLQCVRRLTSQLAQCRKADDITALKRLARDEKWEIRKEVADHLHLFPDEDFVSLAALLTEDESAWVKGSAERAMQRRRRGEAAETRRRRGVQHVERELSRLESTHGRDAAQDAGDLALRLYEVLMGTSVHELRSVVTAIRSNVEHLVRAQDSPRDFERAGQRALPRIVGTIDFLERILTDMRTYSQTLSKERTAERLADLVTEANRLVIEELSARQLDTDVLDVSIEVPPMLTAKVSRVSIVMVFRNVVKNACEAILDRNDRFRGTVKVTARELDSSLIEIVISDTGPGLEPSELDQVRDFLPGKTSKKYVGTGFGLPIARRNLRAHGGSIQIDSAPEEGTRVTMFLPQDPREEVAV